MSDRISGRLRVLQSQRVPRPTTNPYNKMLDEALAAEPTFDHLRFTWREALRGDYDVFHWHWPEALLSGSRRWKVVGKHVALGAVILRHRLMGVAVVRTVHNLELPDTNPVARWMLSAIEKMTTLRITLNETTRLPGAQPFELIPHGHYRDWYERFPKSDPVPGRVGYFGNIRRYKSVDSLLDAYAEAAAQDSSLSLRIGGSPSSADLAESVSARLQRLPDADGELRFLSDADLVTLATSSQIIVLPYRFMHNSGSVLAALSLGRPVLVPRNDTNEALAREVGAGWVHMYDGELTADALRRALKETADIARSVSPDLSHREWADAGRLHGLAYKRALGLKKE